MRKEDVLILRWCTGRLGLGAFLGAVSALWQFSVSEPFSPQPPVTQAVLKQARFIALTQVSLPILGLGGLLFTWMLFQFRLVPRWISVIGLIGYAVVFLAGIAGWFDLIDVSPGGNGTLLAVPVAVWEIILLPFWLFFRGFRMPEATEEGVSKGAQAHVQVRLPR